MNNDKMKIIVFGQFIFPVHLTYSIVFTEYYYVVFKWECMQKNEPVCNFFTNILLIFQYINFFSV